MSIPGFTAAGSLYRSGQIYYSSTADSGPGPSDSALDHLVPAWVPTLNTRERCQTRLDACGIGFSTCLGVSVFSLGLGSVACLGLYHACLGEALIPGQGNELSPCCPTLCDFGDFVRTATYPPDDIILGCCDAGDRCVSPNDRNSRSGCCPSDQSVCGDACCAKGESCCGDTCCPPNFHCRDGFCSEFISDFPSTPPPAPLPHSCSPGSAPCGFPDSSGVIRTCCPPGLQCCNFINGQPVCATSCLH